MVSGLPPSKNKRKKFKASFELDDDSDLFSGISPSRKKKITDFIVEDFKVKYESELTEKISKKIKQNLLKKEQDEAINSEDLRALISSFQELELEASAKSLVLHDERLLLEKSKLPKSFYISYVLTISLSIALAVYAFLPIIVFALLAFSMMAYTINKFDINKENLLSKINYSISETGSIIANCKSFTIHCRQIKTYKSLLAENHYLRESHRFLENSYVVDPRKIENARIICENRVSSLNDDDNFIERLQLREAEIEEESNIEAKKY